MSDDSDKGAPAASGDEVGVDAGHEGEPTEPTEPTSATNPADISWATGWNDRAPRRSAAGSCLKALAIAFLALVAATVLGLFWLSLALRQPEPPKQEIVPAQVRQSSVVATVSNAAPVVLGHFKLNYDQSVPGFAAGLSLGWPQVLPGGEAVPTGSAVRVPFQDPLVRLSITRPGAKYASYCVGPCEIGGLSETCQSRCTLDIPFQVELAPDATSTPIQVTITAAGSVAPADKLPDGLSVSVTIDGPTAEPPAQESTK